MKTIYKLIEASKKIHESVYSNTRPESYDSWILSQINTSNKDKSKLIIGCGFNIAYGIDTVYNAVHETALSGAYRCKYIIFTLEYMK